MIKKTKIFLCIHLKDDSPDELLELSILKDLKNPSTEIEFWEISEIESETKIDLSKFESIFYTNSSILPKLLDWINKDSYSIISLSV